jgi:hypothetical protein
VKSAAKDWRCRFGFHKVVVLRMTLWFDYCRCLRCNKHGYRLGHGGPRV